jgi:hypothetical protein
VRDLADRLRVEYGGAVPPSRVSGTVYHAYRAVVLGRVAAELRLPTCERIVRCRLTDMVANELWHARRAARRRPASGRTPLG